MNLRTFIERAEKCVGSQKKLGEQIGQSPSALRSAKAGLIGLPNYACIMIADLIGEDRITVIAASELATEKKESRKKIWQAIIAHTSLIALTVLLSFSPPENTNTRNSILPTASNLCTFPTDCRGTEQINPPQMAQHKIFANTPWEISTGAVKVKG